ncbi:MAG TPA: glycosyltransferase family 2 protein [Lachnospiraceae bacterium]|nr:glycosyltransferase family 2 protein [Lachnospiraceae bacterium]
MKTIGLVMIVKNEGRCLGKCLSLAKGLVDGIYITDTGSDDNTVEIAREHGAHISHFAWRDDFAAAKNYALEQSPCDWNLILDADEYLVSGRRKELQAFVEKGGRLGAIERHDSYREDSGEISQSCTYTTRLIPRGTFLEGRVHEQVASDLPVVAVPLVFDHDGYLQEGKGERNLEILLDELGAAPEDSYLLYQAARTLWLMKEYVRADKYFEKFYRLVPVTGTGYRMNGIVSYIYNLIELGKYDEGLEVIEKEKNRLGGYADFQFACGTFYTKMVFSDVQRYIAYLPEIERSYRRCLKIGEVSGHECVRGNGSFKAAYNLGVWFEVNGKQQAARTYYRQAAALGYRPAAERLRGLGGK